MLDQIAAQKPKTMEWLQPKAIERYYELRDKDSMIASMRFRSSGGTLAIVRANVDSWSFKRVGFAFPKVTLRKEGEEVNYGEYQPKVWGDGVLTLTNNLMFRFKPLNFSSTYWAFLDASDQVLLRFLLGLGRERHTNELKTQALVEVVNPEQIGDLLPLFLSFGFYLILMHQQEGALKA